MSGPGKWWNVVTLGKKNDFWVSVLGNLVGVSATKCERESRRIHGNLV